MEQGVKRDDTGCITSGTGENPNPPDSIRTVVLKFFGGKTLVSPVKNSQHIKASKYPLPQTTRAKAWFLFFVQRGE